MKKSHSIFLNHFTIKSYISLCIHSFSYFLFFYFIWTVWYFIIYPFIYSFLYIFNFEYFGLPQKLGYFHYIKIADMASYKTKLMRPGSRPNFPTYTQENLNCISLIPRIPVPLLLKTHWMIRCIALDTTPQIEAKLISCCFVFYLLQCEQMEMDEY